MKVSDLIQALSKEMDKNGDFDIYTTDDESGFEGLRFVKYVDDKTYAIASRKYET